MRKTGIAKCQALWSFMLKLKLQRHNIHQIYQLTPEFQSIYQILVLVIVSLIWLSTSQYISDGLVAQPLVAYQTIGLHVVALIMIICSTFSVRIHMGLCSKHKPAHQSMLAIGRVVDPPIYMGLFDFLCLFCKHYSPLRSTLLPLLAWSIKGALRQISYIYNGLYLSAFDHPPTDIWDK